MSTQIAPEVFPSKYPQPPELVPVFLITGKIGSVNVGPSDGAKEKTYSTVAIGEIKPIENKLGLKFEVKNLLGNDIITRDLSDNTITLDCDLVGETPNGSKVHVHYGGKGVLNEKFVALREGKTSVLDFDDIYFYNKPTFDLSPDVEKEFAWVNKHTFIGNGRQILDKEKSRYVQYVVYAVA